MKNIKTIFVTLATIFSFMSLTGTAQAQTIGYINLETVTTGYVYARTVGKEINDKAYDIEQYVMKKNKQFKDIESPINKKNFEDQVKKDYIAKKEELQKFEQKKTEEVENNILQAIKAVAAEKNIDVVTDNRYIYFGGVDISQDVVNYLNGEKQKPAKK